MAPVYLMSRDRPSLKRSVICTSDDFAQYVKQIQITEFELEKAEPSWCTKYVDIVSMLDTDGNPFPPVPEPEPEE